MQLIKLLDFCGYLPKIFFNGVFSKQGSCDKLNVSNILGPIQWVYGPCKLLILLT